MGFITLENGEVVHTQALNPNPVVNIGNGREWVKDGVYYCDQITTFKNGEKQVSVLSYNV